MTSSSAAWSRPGWCAASASRLVAELARLDRVATGPVTTEKLWARACLQRVTSDRGPVWAKHGYRLPPGEEQVLAVLSRRHPERVPRVLTTWPGCVVMEQLPGRPMQEQEATDVWVGVARGLAELLAAEQRHVEAWCAAGTRDRRPPHFGAAVRALLGSPVLDGLPTATREQVQAFVPDWIERYDQAWCGAATLVPQDSGCCNVQLTDAGPLFFDWADVVVGHPVFSGDRLLDQVPAEAADAVVAAFCEPLGLERQAFDALRRSNVLHEVLRYHDELEHIAPDDPVHANLSRSVCAQLEVLVAHESRTRRGAG